MKTVRQSLLTICIAVATVCAGTAYADADDDVRLVTLVQDADYAPFMTAEESGPAGIYAEIIKEADKRLPGYKIELTSAPWTRAKFLVQSGKVNGLVGTYHKPIRRPWIRHFSTPMATETIYVYCREGVAQDHWDYPKDYAGLLFSNNAGFLNSGHVSFLRWYSAGKIQLIEEQTTDANLRLLQLGRADCYVQQQEAVELSIQSIQLRQDQTDPGSPNGNRPYRLQPALERGGRRYLHCRHGQCPETDDRRWHDPEDHHELDRRHNIARRTLSRSRSTASFLHKTGLAQKPSPYRP
jgi:polar amino acid transport system substrate-binding protein